MSISVEWNPVEHKLFSYISINWAGKPLRSFETMLAYIQDTTTETGLQVEAHLIQDNYKQESKFRMNKCRLYISNGILPAPIGTTLSNHIP